MILKEIKIKGRGESSDALILGKAVIKARYNITKVVSTEKSFIVKTPT